MLSKFSSEGNVSGFVKRFLGISPQSALMLTSVFNPYGVNGFNPIFLIGFEFLFTNYLYPSLGTGYDWEEERRITDAPRKALEDNVSAGFHDLASNAFWFGIRTSFMNYVVRPGIDSFFSAAISNLVPNAISNLIYSETSTCHFLSKEKDIKPGSAKNEDEQSKNIFALINKTNGIIENINRSIELPFQLYKLWNCTTTLYYLAKPMTEFLPYPFNFKYGLVGFVGASALTKLAFDKALHKFLTAFDNSSREYDSHKLKDHILNNSKDILSRNASAAVTHKLQSCLKDENRSYLVNEAGPSFFKEFLTGLFERSQNYIVNIVIGSAILSTSSLNYRDHFVPIISASTTITALLNNLSYVFLDWLEMRDNIDNLNELMERISEAKSLSEEARNKVIIANEGKLLELSTDFVLQVPGSEPPTISKRAINPKEIIRLNGVNGVGKSTLITSILLGDNIKAGSVKRTDSLHISIQDYTPIPGFTLFQDIAGSETIEEDKLKNIKNLFARFPQLFSGREINKNTTTDKFSGGQMKAIKLISAIASGKKLVILDEPFAGMDPFNIAICINLIKEEKEKGRGFLIVDHLEKGADLREGFYTGSIEMKKTRRYHASIESVYSGINNFYSASAIE